MQHNQLTNRKLFSQFYLNKANYLGVILALNPFHKPGMRKRKHFEVKKLEAEENSGAFDFLSSRKLKQFSKNTLFPLPLIWLQSLG